MKDILIVGVGSIGERHLRCMLKTGRVRAGICEINTDLLEKVKNNYDITSSFTSLDEALSHRWDAAVIASPANSHIPIAQKLAKNNINLLIEKPLAVETQGIEHLIETVNQNNLCASVAYIYRAHPALAKVKKIIKDENLGKPLQLNFYCGFPFAFYRPAYPNTYFKDHKMGGGCVQDCLTHYFNLCEWFLGPINQICAQGDHKSLKDVDIEDTVHALARHGDVMASYSVNMYQPAYEIRVGVVCSEGQVKCEITSYDKSVIKTKSAPNSEWQIEEFVLENRDEWFVQQENHFLDTLDGKKNALCSIHEAYQTLKVNLATLDSIKKMSWKTIQ